MKALSVFGAAFVLVFGLLSLEGADAARKTIRVDGSSTVFPITEAISEEFGKLDRNIRVTVGVSGTGGGFKKFCAGEIDVNDASRRIKQKEIDKCKKAGVQFVELPVAYDGISVVINKNNNWVDHLTVAELKKIWRPGSTVKTWKDVRPNWPDKKIRLYGPGADSGTFDYFTKAINGKSQASRSGFTKSEDDNVLVTGVQGDLGSLGYFGFAYYAENRSKLKAVPIKVKANDLAVAPSMTTINKGTYKPLSRPIFIYVSKRAALKAEVKKFIEYYLENAGTLVQDVGYVPLQKKEYTSALEKFRKLLQGNVAKR